VRRRAYELVLDVPNRCGRCPSNFNVLPVAVVPGDGFAVDGAGARRAAVGRGRPALNGRAGAAGTWNGLFRPDGGLRCGGRGEPRGFRPVGPAPQLSVATGRGRKPLALSREEAESAETYVSFCRAPDAGAGGDVFVLL